jgi:hypothetical protein
VLDQFDSLVPVSRFAHNDKAWIRFQQGAQPLPHDNMIIR